MPGSLSLVKLYINFLIKCSTQYFIRVIIHICFCFVFKHRRPPVNRPNTDRKINPAAWCCIRRRGATTASAERGRRQLAATQKDLLRCGQVSDVKNVLKIRIQLVFFFCPLLFIINLYSYK